MKRKVEKEGNHERWLLTYSDLITLLMIFFIILYSMSNVNVNKYKELSNSFKGVLGGGEGIVGGDNKNIIDGYEGDTKVLSEEGKLSDIKDNLEKYASESQIKDSITTTIEERGLVISFKDTMFFDVGRAEIKEVAKERLIKISGILNKIDNYIRVEGHTDDTPIKNDSFKSNWQLSAIRATNVTEFLIEGGKVSPERISSVGYGEYRPIDKNNSESERGKNRRVDIVLLNSKFNNSENKK
ncbi:OmpA/MotB family protein [Clostridium hydrogeniformans]|uniref:OmpA/MotB family protein n=1 Tax=Clostridium hydrogeniformans TaxID=349933 RepID=UPI00048610D5|nr:flagellar motor protein MotB [Clostridium hydrogeniformans]